MYISNVLSAYSSISLISEMSDSEICCSSRSQLLIKVQVNKNLFYLSYGPLNHETAVTLNASGGRQSTEWSQFLLDHPEKANAIIVTAQNDWKLAVASTCLLEIWTVDWENVLTCQFSWDQISMSSLKLDIPVCSCTYRAKARMESLKSSIV